MLSPLHYQRLSDFKEKIEMMGRILRRGELTPKKLLNLGKNMMAMIRHQTTVPGYPSLLMIEPTNTCNIACTFCDTGRGLTIRPKSFMSIENFRKIIDEMSEHVLFLFLYYIGEPFMHPKIYEMINYANKKKISIYTSTNGLLIDTPEKAGKLVESGLDTLLISFTGADKENYERYQPGGNFDKLIRNIKMITQEKKKRKSRTPVLKLRFMMMKHNEADIIRIKSIASETGVDILNIRAIWVQDKKDPIKEFIPEDEKYSRYHVKNEKLQKKSRNKGRCQWLWLGGIVGVDGKALPCCVGFNEVVQMGDITAEGGLKAIWNNDSYRQMRLEILNKTYRLPHCADCSGLMGYQDFT